MTMFIFFLFGLFVEVLLVVWIAEFCLKEKRVQSCLPQVFPVFVLAAVINLVVGYFTGYNFPVLLGLLWAGVFLCWFGIRSHLESSILLHMLVLLREKPVSRQALIDAYLQSYGPAERLDELKHAGLLKPGSQGAVLLTPRGQRLVQIVQRLGRSRQNQINE